MKKSTLILLCTVLGFLAGFGINRASAQLLGSDNAALYTAWGSGNTGGIGYQPWVMYNTGGAGGSTGYAGTYLGHSGSQVGSTNGYFWGMYANSATTAGAEAFRAFSNSIPANATFTILWQNTGIGNNNYNAAGFNLRNGDNTNLMTAANFIEDGSLFSMYYIGGISDNYFVYDGNGVNPIPVNFADGNVNGLQIQVTILPGSMYNLVVENAAGTQVYYSAYSQPLVGSGTIDSLALYAFDTDNDQKFNKMQILYLAPQLANLTPTSGSVYVPTTSPLSFDLTSTASTISSNNVQLLLNGVLQTGSAWTVTGSGTADAHVVLNAPLQGNLTYNGTVIATDAAGNTSSNTFTFNTWLPAYNNIYIEGADYNYQGGQYIDNALYLNGSTPVPAGSYAQPNQIYGQFDLLAEQSIDCFVDNTAGTNNVYRTGDLPGVEAATDIDHNNFAANGFTPYDLDFNENGQWEDYTRQLSNNVTYAVYARMSAFGANPTMLLSRMAAPTVNGSNQPNAALGTFVAPNTGAAQNYTFVPLKDFFSNPVLINFGGTNTFRVTDVGGSGSYNLGYMLLLATNNVGTLRPYVASGFPYPSATGVNPEGLFSFTIANRQTSVDPSTIQLLVNSNNVTGSITLSNNAAGTVVTYQPTLSSLLLPGQNTAEVIFSDDSVWMTNTWQFTGQPYAVLPTAWALPLNASYSPGFYEQIAKGDDSATNTDFPPSLARAVAQLAGTLTNSVTGLPYANEALNGGINVETNTINYAIDANFFGLFTPTNPFPDIVAGTTNNVAMAANMYVQLTPGLYNFDVYSDDGFQFSAGPTPASTNIILGIADYGRAATTTQFTFVVQTAGLYPMQLIYFKAQEGGGGVELYYNGSSGNVLLNDPNTSGSIKAYYLVPVPKLSLAQSGKYVVLTWIGSGYNLASATAINGPYTVINGATSGYQALITGTQEYFRLVPSP